MKANINIGDSKDAFLLGEAIGLAIKELAEIRDKASSWGCATEIQDRIDRLMRMSRSLKY